MLAICMYISINQWLQRENYRERRMRLDSKYAKWRCNGCDDLHDDEDDARDCCRPTVNEVYLCPVCDSQNSDEGDAIACCEASQEIIDTLLSRGPTGIALERLGQLRLIP
jgi:hypothetical protein